jgi:hypothetical protein
VWLSCPVLLQPCNDTDEMHDVLSLLAACCLDNMLCYCTTASLNLCCAYFPHLPSGACDNTSPYSAARSGAGSEGTLATGGESRDSTEEGAEKAHQTEAEEGGGASGAVSDQTSRGTETGAGGPSVTLSAVPSPAPSGAVASSAGVPAPPATEAEAGHCTLRHLSAMPGVLSSSQLAVAHAILKKAAEELNMPRPGH